jgi:GNAT superfamily N-acetyltransferase
MGGRLLVIDENIDRAERIVAVTRTYLEMQSPSQLQSGAPPAVASSWVRVDPCSVQEWRALYRDIGGPWHWHDRDAWPDERLAEHLASDAVRIVRVDAKLPTGPLHAAGFVELERHADGSVEISYLGLDNRAHGLGLGRWIVVRATEEAWSMRPTRVWLHTCTLDGAAALPNYIARGFEVERTEEYTTVIRD